MEDQTVSLESLDPQCLEVLRLVETSGLAGPWSVESARAADLWRMQRLAAERSGAEPPTAAERAAARG
jgi:hypothetical protein